MNKKLKEILSRITLQYRELLKIEHEEAEPIAEKEIKLFVSPIFEALGDRSFEDTTRLLRSAVMDKLGKKNSKGLIDEPYPWLDQVFEDFIIVNKGDELLRLDYEINSEGEVTLEEPEQVKVQYIPITEGNRIKESTVIELKEKATPGALLEANFDKKNMIVHNVVFLGPNSSRGYTYKEEAIQEALPLFEGATMYIDHQSEESVEKGDVRSVHELLGQAKNARVVGDKVRGDMHLVNTADIRNNIFPIMEHFKDQIGNSLAGFGEKVKENGKEVVVKITHVNSIDLVTRPGTTSGLFESRKKNSDKNKNGGNTKVTIEEILEALKDSKINEAVTAHIMAEAEQTGKIEELEKIVVVLKKDISGKDGELDKFKVKEAHEEKVHLCDKLIKESKLPDEAVTKTWKKQLLASKDEGDMREMLSERKDFYTKLTATKPLNWEKDTGKSDGEEITPDDVARSYQNIQ